MFQIQNKSGTWVTVAEPKIGGIGVTDEPIWASNTGRSSTGKMIGDIVDWKTTIEVAWPPLTYVQMKQIRDAIGAGDKSRNFFKIKYKDIDTSSSVTDGQTHSQQLNNMTVEKTVYVANIPRLMYSLSSEYPRYAEVKIQFVEQ